jgi:uncharacterized membrane protein YraQ (UPF0718 family)
VGFTLLKRLLTFLKELLIFLVIGPLIGGWIFAFLTPQPMEMMERPYQATMIMTHALPLALAIGFGPALLSVIANDYLRNRRWGIVYAALVGGLFAGVALHSWRSAFAGFVAALICSYFANRPPKEAILHL